MTQPHEPRLGVIDVGWDPRDARFNGENFDEYIPDDPRTLLDFVPEEQFNSEYNAHMDKYADSRSNFRLPEVQHPSFRPFKIMDPSAYSIEQKAAIFDMLYFNGIREMDMQDSPPRDYPCLQYILGADQRDQMYHVMNRLLQGVIRTLSVGNDHHVMTVAFHPKGHAEGGQYIDASEIETYISLTLPSAMRADLAWFERPMAKAHRELSKAAVPFYNTVHNRRQWSKRVYLDNRYTMPINVLPRPNNPSKSTIVHDHRDTARVLGPAGPYPTQIVVWTPTPWTGQSFVEPKKRPYLRDGGGLTRLNTGNDHAQPDYRAGRLIRDPPPVPDSRGYEPIYRMKSIRADNIEHDVQVVMNQPPPIERLRPRMPFLLPPPGYHTGVSVDPPQYQPRRRDSAGNATPQASPRQSSGSGARIEDAARRVGLPTPPATQGPSGTSRLARAGGSRRLEDLDDDDGDLVNAFEDLSVGARPLSTPPRAGGSRASHGSSSGSRPSGRSRQ